MVWLTGWTAVFLTESTKILQQLLSCFYLTLLSNTFSRLLPKTSVSPTGRKIVPFYETEIVSPTGRKKNSTFYETVVSPTGRKKIVLHET